MVVYRTMGRSGSIINCRGYLPSRHGSAVVTKGVRRRATSNGKNAAPSSSAPFATGMLQVGPTALAVGSLAGLLGSLAGMGGGFVMIPLMTSRSRFLNLRLTQHEAHGTSLFAVAATGLAGAVSYGPDTVQYPEAAAIAFTAMVTARWGAQATVGLSAPALKRALGWLMVAMAPAVPAKAYFLHHLDHQHQQLEHQQLQQQQPALQKEPAITTATTTTNNNLHQLLAPALIGVGSGFLAGLFGVGGGTVVVPALALFTDMNHHQALGTSLAAMTLPALSGTYAHYQAGNCSVRVAPFLAAGALLGAYIGAQQSLQTNETALRWGFSALLLTLGVRTLVKG